MSKKIISKMSLKTIVLAAVVTVCGVFCFDYIIGNEASASGKGSLPTMGCSSGGGKGPGITSPGSTAGSGSTKGK
ncbi:MAG: hypothetical protein K2Y08_04420 [Alphaproteobacteria bacterium]|nr:hypothetical protein [Alphaproteobacteria bacterium]